MDSETVKDRIQKMYKGEKITKTKLVRFNEEDEIIEEIEKDKVKEEKKNDEVIGVISRIRSFFGF